MSLARFPLSCLLAPLALAGCTLGPAQPPPPTINIPNAPLADATPPVPDAWWRLYADPALDGLVAQALERNRDLRAGAAAVLEARALLGAREDERQPQTALTAGAGYGSTATDQLAAALAQTPVRTGPRYDLGFQLGWEVDLVGRLRQGVAAATADVAAAQAVADGLRVVVAAATTRAYADACAYAARLAMARRSVALLDQGLDVRWRLRDAGAATPLDVARAAALLDQARAALPPLEAGRRNALYELAALTGQPPDAVPDAAARCEAPPRLAGPLPLGDVTGLLRRRPDVRAAERRLAASTARIGVAMADLYPRVTLGAGVADSAPGINGLSQSQNVVWSVGPLLSWRFPNVGAARAAIAGAQAHQAGDLARFDAAILTALKEVRQALALYEAAEARRTALAQATAHADEALRLARLGRRSGAATALEVLDAERGAVTADTDLATADAAVTDAEITLFKALGGGWAEAPAVTPAATDHTRVSPS